MNSLYIGIACLLLLSILVYESFKAQKSIEGFASNENYFASYYPKRSDVVPGQIKEPESRFIRDLRYKEEYVDVQKIGAKSDLCRVVSIQDDPGSMILACALAGTDGSSSTHYRTKSKAEGFKFSRDDYFRDINKDGRDDYCRIVKVSPAPKDRWEPMCAIASLEGFLKKEQMDTNPPTSIKDLLWFYEGIMIWYRFKDDMLDYSENTNLTSVVNLKIDEDPTRSVTEGVHLNKTYNLDTPIADQFIRIGENSKMEMEDKVTLREFRAFSTWVKFDVFTNNARIFDFGNGAGHDNVFLGIEGKGNDTSPINETPLSPDNIVCSKSAAKELSPQLYLKSTDADVDRYQCPGPEPIDGTTTDTPSKKRKERTANLLFEIWDKEQRKMRIKVIDAVRENRWHHIAITTSDLSLIPTWVVYIDGQKVFTKESGFLPQSNYVTLNYIGRSNWEIALNQGEYKDERLRGSLFDFRMYRIPMSETKILKTVEWGKQLLTLK